MKKEGKLTLSDIDKLTLNQLIGARDDVQKKANTYYRGIIDSINEFSKNENKRDNSSIMEYIKAFLDNLLQYVTLRSRMEELNRNLSLLEEANIQKENSKKEPKTNDEIMDIVQEENNTSKGDNNNKINSKKYKI